MHSVLASGDESFVQGNPRRRKLQVLGILSGLTAGAWLGAAEAPTKLVAVGMSPVVISLVMVMGSAGRPTSSFGLFSRGACGRWRTR